MEESKGGVFVYLTSPGLLFNLYVGGLRPLFSALYLHISYMLCIFCGLRIRFVHAEECGNFATNFNETKLEVLL